MLEAVFIDFWNTLFVSSVHVDEYFRVRAVKLFEVYRRSGCDLSLDFVHDTLLHARRLCDAARKTGLEVPLNLELNVMDSMMNLFDLDADVFRALEEAYLYPLLNLTAPRKGSDVFISALKDMGLKLGLISNTFCGRDIVDGLRRWSLYDYFDVLVFSSDLGLRKPRGEIFQYGLLSLRVKPENAVMIGDDFEADIRGATDLGMRALWLSDAVSDYPYTIQDFQSALSYIKGWVSDSMD